MAKRKANTTMNAPEPRAAKAPRRSDLVVVESGVKWPIDDGPPLYYWRYAGGKIRLRYQQEDRWFESIEAMKAKLDLIKAMKSDA